MHIYEADGADPNNMGIGFVPPARRLMQILESEFHFISKQAKKEGKKEMRTRITDLLKIEYPIICGGMFRVGRAPLAAAVSEAGGLGIITSATFETAEELRQEIRRARKLQQQNQLQLTSICFQVSGKCRMKRILTY